MWKLTTIGTPKASLVLALLVIPAAIGLGGCVSVPRESVDLSYAVGQDIESLHESYIELITRYFETLQGQVNDAIDQVFVPAYINDFVTSGKLMQHAQDQRADLVEAWARIAVKRIDRERHDRLQPLDDAKRELLASVNEAFRRVQRANATITAELSSVLKTQHAQDEMLESVKLKDLRERIYSALANASARAEKITSDIKSTDKSLDHINNRTR